jgi:hypothetical protein
MMTRRQEREMLRKFRRMISETEKINAQAKSMKRELERLTKKKYNEVV